MRHMSFAMTTQQVRDGTKGVTRRYGWDDIKVGELLQAVEKSQGLKKGEHVKKLAVIRVTTERWEPLTQMVEFPEYSKEEVILEGFPDMPPEEFVLSVSSESTTKQGVTNYAQGTARTDALTALYSMGAYSVSAARSRCTTSATIRTGYLLHRGHRSQNN